MENKLISYSRAGDVFHYRWAACRCLRLIHPKSPLKCIVIEGSKESKAAGEYVIDVSEYEKIDENSCEKVSYFQLKHSTKRVDKCFTLSELKKTINGFANRFRDLCCKGNKAYSFGSVKFVIISNRQISEKIKASVREIGKGGIPNGRFKRTLEKYTRLDGEHLQHFCDSFDFADGEGDYVAQRHKLHVELAKLLAGSVNEESLDSIVALVQDQVLPHSNGKIVREDVLNRLGVTSERDLFPVPQELEKLTCAIKREQHDSLLKQIVATSTPIIIHASGGVGKSVVCRQLSSFLPEGSLSIIYDCFGAGKYRNRSEPRHRHRDALVQIINEIASHNNLCDFLIPRSTDLDDAFLRAFLSRLRVASVNLKKSNPGAILAILIDAADNAEMAAKEFSDTCFAHDLLGEDIPVGCRLVMFARTERLELLNPPSRIGQFELKPFSEKETSAYLLKHFPDATNDDSLEFHRLTGGNPRVQANALNVKHRKIADVLLSFGPSGITVDAQIEAQINAAVSVVKDKLSPDFQNHIDAICLGLANLPPFIPIDVLATVAGVQENEVKTFVADLGRPLWLSDNFVQFRDEPTETWFRKNFSATKEQIESYVEHLKPLALKSAYVAEAIPSLLLQSGNCEELISLALSDNLLPKDNPIDKRNIRVYRLQFAFKAALKQKRYVDAIKLALRAGEEVAGDNRQMELFAKNVDLISPLQSEQRVQELARRRMIRAMWDGSENVYSAALLSSVPDFKGEARSYLRSAENWLRLYFDERKKDKNANHDDRLKDADIVELAFTHLNLFGHKELVRSILSWSPPEVIFRITRLLVRRLVDTGDFIAIDKITQFGCQNQYLMIAAANELLTVGRYAPKGSMRRCLDLLIDKKQRIAKPALDWHENAIVAAIISFSEACFALKLSRAKILRVINHYFPKRASRSASSEHQNRERDPFLRAIALKSVISGKDATDLKSLMPKDYLKKRKNYYNEQDVKEFTRVIGGLLPWYLVRSHVLIGGKQNLSELIHSASEKSKQAASQGWREYDRIPFEITNVHFEILVLSNNSSDSAIEDFIQQLSTKDAKFWLSDRLKALRAACRLDHLLSIRQQLEQSCSAEVSSAKEERPETRAEWYIDLARAVLPISREDAAAYFDYAIEAVSKFGDEALQRWEAVMAIAKRSAENGYLEPRLTYRFMRCAELIGEYIEEKHFDRDGVVRACAKMSPVSVFATLSRWRDRDVGWFNRLISALAEESVSEKILTPSAGWSLSAFFNEGDLTDFAVLCIEQESDPNRRQYILDMVVHDLRMKDTLKDHYQKIASIAQKNSLKNSELQKVLDFYAVKSVEAEKNSKIPQGNYTEETSNIDWHKILGDLDLSTNAGVFNAVNRFNSMPAPRSLDAFWKEVLIRVPEDKICNFLRSIAEVDNLDIYDVREILSNFPNDWRKKASVKRIWLSFISSVGRRFAFEFTNQYTLQYFLSKLSMKKEEISSIYEGVIDGFSDSHDLAGANAFFGFCGIASSLVSPQEARKLLDFAITRFEEHIDSSFGDGPWADYLYPPENITEAFTGLIWAALGSPESVMRWQAAHCVRRLVESGCESEIDALIEWMKRDSVNSFGHHEFPFYNYHARQHLLMALSRVAIDDPSALKRHSMVFSQLALEGMPHVLIQKYAKDIALSIETAFPGTYEAHVCVQLRNVGISQFPKIEIEGYDANLKSPWHSSSEIDKKLELYFNYDFDSYWFPPLGDAFGISSGQVEDFAREIVIKEWHIKLDDKFIRDPRNNLWRSYRHERETWHSHSSYPRIDDYSFYISYHAMLSVAAKLLNVMPVIYRKHYWHDDDPWINWLGRHTLTRADGRWLADRRDPLPLERRSWLHKEKTKKWPFEIETENFLEGLLIERDGKTWLNVYGSWNDCDSEYGNNENIHVSSALVSQKTSQALLNALTTCQNPHDFRLPNYKEENMEFVQAPFELMGWIKNHSVDTEIDGFDPHAGEISYPPYGIGKTFIEQFGLSCDQFEREWYLPEMKQASLATEIWSLKRRTEREEFYRSGNRIQASLEFLKMFCKILKYELILKVEIERREHRSYYARSYDGNKYKPPHFKIYILSANGILRDTETKYKLR